MTTIPLAPPSLAGSCDLPGSFGRTTLKRLPIWSCSVRGLACHSPYGERGALLPHLFTLTRLRPNGLRRAVCFLCHFPSDRPDRELPGALSFGVRTFLPTHPPKRTGTAVVWPTAAECQRTTTLPVGLSGNVVLLELLIEITTGGINLLSRLGDIPTQIPKFSHQERSFRDLLELAEPPKIRSDGTR